MKAMFANWALSPVLNKLAKSVDNSSLLDITRFIRVRVEDKKAVLSVLTFGRHVQVAVPCDTDHPELWECAIPAKIVDSIVKTFPDNKTITLEIVSDASHPVIRCDDMETNVASAKVGDFPNFPAMDSEYKTFGIRAGQFLSMATCAKSCVPTNDPRKILQGVQFEFDPVGKFHAVATDGKRLAKYTLGVTDIENPTDIKNASFVVPGDDVSNLIDLFSDAGEEDTIEVSFDDKQAQFVCGSVHYNVMLIEGKYPNWRAVMPTDFTHYITLHREPLVSTVRRASILSDVKNNALSVIFKPGEPTVIHAESYDRGKYEETVQGDVGHKFDDTVVLNYKYFSSILKEMTGDVIEVLINVPTKPVVFRPVGNDNQEFLIMPIKVTEIREDDDEDEEEDGEE